MDNNPFGALAKIGATDMIAVRDANRIRWVLTETEIRRLFGPTAQELDLSAQLFDRAGHAGAAAILRHCIQPQTTPAGA